MTTRVCVRSIGSLVIALACFLSPRLGLAQAPPPDAMDINTFNVAVGDNVYITQHGARVPGHLKFGVGLMFNYQRRPFTVYDVNPNGNPGSVRTEVVENLFIGELYGYLGIANWISVGLGMPLGLYQTGTTTNDDGTPAAGGGLDAFSWGDLAIHVKARLHELKKVGIAFGALLTITAPTGQFAEQFFGEESVTFRPRVMVEYRFKRLLQVAINLGGIFRVKETKFFNDNFKMGQQFTYGVGFAIQPAKKVPLRILAEVYGRTDFSNRLERHPLEAGAGASYRLPRGVHLLLGVNAGILAGIGAPDVRVYLGIRWAPSFKDSDKDGVADDRDKCPSQLEDKDGFEDDDGCPDPDNDKDGIPDKKDKCPDQREDLDDFEDDDGCPDLDNDKDGVPDRVDRCPLQKGTIKARGCPAHLADSDGDGVPDAKDKCNGQAEDKDGFQDEDGCPDPDNDNDGIPDTHDKCKNDPEDKDGYQDADGCPDPDNDSDGVCDAHPTVQKHLARYRGICIGRDRCEGKKETINGRKDSDGCPDRGKGDLVFSAQKGTGFVGRFLTPKKRILFKGNSTRMRKGSTRILLQLAHYLRAFQGLKKVAIMAHTDLRTSTAVAKRVTEAWAQAIKAYLVARGIAPHRLTTVGAGKASPLCKGRSRRCSKKNRRVEFYITEIGR